MLEKLRSFFLNRTIWAFWAVILWNGIGRNQQQGPPYWTRYAVTIGTLSLFLAPILAFEWWRPVLKKRLSTVQYSLIWGGCFVVYFPLAIFLLAPFQPLPLGEYDFWAAALWCFWLGVLLEINDVFQGKGRTVTWLGRLGLEKAIVLTLALLAVSLALMAVSSIGDPRFHTKEQLLVGFVIRPDKIVQHFDLFLSFSFQLFMMYMIGYACFFIHRHFLVSIILKKKGAVIYGLALLFTVAALYPILAQLLNWMPINDTFGRIFSANPFQFENGMGMLGIMLISLPVILAMDWFQQNHRIAGLEKEKMQAELSLLKQQLNPHFFFNTLNNLYALSLEKSDKAPESILLLSELMRYVIYKGNQPQVPIELEIRCLEDYIALQRLRIAIDSEITFTTSINDNTMTIPPLLLIIFVENAFKHGIEPAEKPGFLSLSLESSQKSLTFTCLNSFESLAPSAEGIGLQNLRRRLELLYPKRHILTIEKGNGIFKAVLKLQNQ